jgi:hypothetical protein
VRYSSEHTFSSAHPRRRRDPGGGPGDRRKVNATHTFDRTAPDGTVLTADELTRATATNLHGEFATVVTTRQLTAT